MRVQHTAFTMVSCKVTIYRTKTLVVEINHPLSLNLLVLANKSEKLRAAFTICFRNAMI